jgi:prepilin-type N-terminal cleavage/methylation domain-containing protein
MYVAARYSRGFTLLELMVALVLAGLVLGATSGLIKNALGTDEVVSERNQLLRDARFAMERMTSAAKGSRRLLLPQADNSSTNWPENIREETDPASPPIGDSTKATAVLALTLPEYVDLDADGFPDADNDRDGRIDEDTPADMTWDLAPGIALVDDDGDGSVDEGSANNDDDEALGTSDEDPLDGLDDDGDGNTDEDFGADMNGDGCPGLCGVDDDGDGQIDEGSSADDDEDGNTDEDFYGALVFYLDDGVVKERMPVPWDISGGGLVSGLDYMVSDIADNVTRFRVERPAASASGEQLVYLTLELTGPTGTVVSLTSRIRVGGGL